MKTLLRMHRAEWQKLRGRGLLPAMLLFGAMHGVGAVVFVKLSEILEHKANPDAIDSLDFLAPMEAASFLVNLPIHGLALLFLFSILWAEDFNLGTIGMVFVRPVRRSQVFLAKVLAGWSIAAVSFSLALLVGAVLGLLLFGVDADVSALQGRPVFGWMHDQPDFGPRLLRVLVGALCGLLIVGPILGMAAFVGSVARSPVLTLIGAMMLLLFDALWAAGLKAYVSFELSGHEHLAKIKDINILSGRDFWGHHGDLTVFTEAAQALGVTIFATIALLGLGLLIFSKRDVD